MSAGRLVVVIRGDEIVVTQPGSNFSAVYYKPRDEPQLIAKGTPSGNYKFLARAWQAANDKARELGVDCVEPGPAPAFSFADCGPKLDGDSVR